LIDKSLKLENATVYKFTLVDSLQTSSDWNYASETSMIWTV